jgi:2-hydroxychromene-2-carboxylate isomerase
LPAGYNDKMIGQNDHANAIRLLRALVARGANSKEPMANAWITQVALEIGLDGDELNSALAYALTQNWLEDSNMTGRTLLTPAGEGAEETS